MAVMDDVRIGPCLPALLIISHQDELASFVPVKYPFPQELPELDFSNET
jgi:hypothetical protein